MAGENGAGHAKCPFFQLPPVKSELRGGICATVFPVEKLQHYGVFRRLVILTGKPDKLERQHVPQCIILPERQNEVRIFAVFFMGFRPSRQGAYYACVGIRVRNERFQMSVFIDLVPFRQDDVIRIGGKGDGQAFPQGARSFLIHRVRKPVPVEIGFVRAQTEDFALEFRFIQDRGEQRDNDICIGVRMEPLRRQSAVISCDGDMIRP